MIAADYPFLDVFWTMLVFFVWVAWFMLLFRVIGDIFRRDDLSGLGKTGWLIFVILLPFLGVFIYLITQNDGMTQREIDRVQARRAQYDEQIRSAAGGAARRRRSRRPSSCSTAAPSHRRSSTHSSRRHWRRSRG